MPVHFGRHEAAQAEFGRPLVDSTFTVSPVTGQGVTDVSQNVFANLGWDEFRLPAPLFEGDAIYSQSAKEDVGMVTVKTTGHNQDGTTVITFRRTVMVYKRGCSPGATRPGPEGGGT